MRCVLPAEFTVFADLNSVRAIFLVLLARIVSLLAFRARKSNCDSHVEHLHLYKSAISSLPCYEIPVNSYFSAPK